MSPLTTEYKCFLSYSHKDKAFATTLASAMQRNGIAVWYDEWDVLGGFRIVQRIEEGLKWCNVFVVIMSPNSMQSRWVQRERESASTMEIPIIPILLADCEIPPLLRGIRYVDFRRAEDYPQRVFELLDAINGVTMKLPPVHVPVEIEMIEIPGGEFFEGPYARLVHVDTFKIGKYPVTNSQYQEFINAGGYEKSYFWSPPGWEWRRERGDRVSKTDWPYDPFWLELNHPAAWLSWYEADAFARWVGKRLPSRVEWEKAARGGIYLDGDLYRKIKNENAARAFPWGDQFDPERCNTLENKDIGMRMGSTPVDHYPQGASPYSVMDMAGNVWEWSSDRYQKGGSYNVEAVCAQCSYYTGWLDPTNRGSDFGFRCAE